MKRFISTDAQVILGVTLSLVLVLFLINLLPFALVLLLAVIVVAGGLFLSLTGRLTLSKDLSKDEEQSLTTLLAKMPIGIVQFDKETKAIIWFNPYIELVFTAEDGRFDEELLHSFIREGKADGADQSRWINGNRYVISVDEAGGYFYCFDRNLHFGEDLVKLSPPAIGVISIDNYDDVADDLSDADISQVNSFVANFIATFAQEKHIFYRRVAMDRFYFFTDYERLVGLMSDEFAILDQFRLEAKALNLPLTLSMGIAYGQNHNQIGTIALENLNMALVRGGDQVVLKEDGPHKKLRYFGGGSVSAVKRTRTRTRAMMTAISDKIRSADQVFVVGHRNTDMDALGATVGMTCFAQNIIPNSYAVYDDEGNPDVNRALDTLKEDGQTQLIRVDRAKKLVTEDSILIMVDHSKSQLTLSKEFYQKFTEVIVIDHHRRDDDFPENAVLTFIESGASSASELVAELLQFQNAKNKPSKIQASILMAGIMLDTQNFSTRVTSRTFDVASYLRGLGSDSVTIRQISATDFEDYRLVNELILRGQPYGGNMIIACGPEDVIYQSAVASKAADTLLGMANVEASFVLTRNAANQVAISARSRSKINVQRTMENLGGGGHFNLAACQLEAVSIAEACEALIKQLAIDMK